MAIIREQDIENTVRRWCKEQNVLFIKMDPTSMRGFPDRMVIGTWGEVMFIELKAKGKKPRANQEKWVKDLRDRDIDADWFDNADAAIRWIESHLKP